MKNNNSVATQSWATFWKSNPEGFNKVMHHSTIFFSEQLESAFPINSHDRVLDLGCGPGFLLQQIHAKAEKIYGADISEAYINICSRLPADNLELSVIKAYDNVAYSDLIKRNAINKVIMLSVVQYYRSELEVKELIKALAEVGKQQPLSLLIADIIPEKHSFLQDFRDIFRHAVKERYVISLVRFMAYALFSDYRKISRKGLLELDINFFEALEKELDIKVSIKKNLTFHSGRYSALIEFSGQ